MWGQQDYILWLRYWCHEDDDDDDDDDGNDDDDNDGNDDDDDDDDNDDDDDERFWKFIYYNILSKHGKNKIRAIKQYMWCKKTSFW